MKTFDQKLKKLSDTCFLLHIEHCNYYYYSEKCSMLHRTNGPAIEFFNGEEWFYHLGALHNESGPAIKKGDLERFFLNGKEYTKEEHARKMSAK